MYIGVLVDQIAVHMEKHLAGEPESVQKTYFYSAVIIKPLIVNRELIPRVLGI